MRLGRKNKYYVQPNDYSERLRRLDDKLFQKKIWNTAILLGLKKRGDVIHIPINK